MEHRPTKSPVSIYKLWFLLIVGVPVAALIAFSSVLVWEKRDVLLEMDEIDNTSHHISQLSDLIHEMQRERGYTSGFIASKGAAFKAELIKQRAATDEQYSLFLNGISATKHNEMHTAMIDIFDLLHFVHPPQRHFAKNATIIHILDLALAELGRLKIIRADVDSLNIGYFDALEYYSKTHSLLLDTIGVIPPLIADREISSLYLAYFYMEQIKEKAGLQRATLTYAFEAGKFLPGQLERFLGIVSDESYSDKRFLYLGPPDIQQAYLKVSTLPEVIQADRMKQIAINKGVKGNFGIDAVYWNAMQTKKIDQINNVCDLFDIRVREIVDVRHAGARDSLIIYLLVNLAVAAFALSMSVLLFRNIVKRREAEESLALYAKRMENSLFRANDVLSFIATSPEIVPFFTVSPFYRSVRSIGGGDIIKWVRFPSQYAGLYLHDVAGHDIEEILLNILATALVETCKTNPAKKSASIPSVFMNQMNKQLTKYCEGKPDYLTAVYLLMDFEKHKIRMAAGGHPRPWLINPDGSVLPVKVPAGFILGQFTIDPLAKGWYQDIVLSPETGQLLLVYSDGLMEQKNAGGTAFGEKFLKEIGPKLAGLEPQTAHELLKREFEAHLNGRVPDDDVSFVLIGTRPANKYETICFVPGPELLSLVRGLKNGRENDLTVPSRPSAARSPSQPAGKPDRTIIHKLSDSYSSIIEILKKNHWEDKRISQVELAVSEMVINAIMHGNIVCDNCTVELSYILYADELEVCVTDEGLGFDSNALPQSIEEDLLLEGGRGHHMINAMADGLYFNDAGNRCWALFSSRITV